MYLTYQEYQNMGGTLDETTFNDYEYEAETLVDWYTFNRLHGETEYPEAVLKCVYHLINLLELKAAAIGTGAGGESGNSDGKVVASQSNDGVSISYNVMAASELATLAKDEMENSIKRYLNGVMNSLGRKLLYRGLYPGE